MKYGLSLSSRYLEYSIESVEELIRFLLQQSSQLYLLLRC